MEEVELELICPRKEGKKERKESGSNNISDNESCFNLAGKLEPVSTNLFFFFFS